MKPIIVAMLSFIAVRSIAQQPVETIKNTLLRGELYSMPPITKNSTPFLTNIWKEAEVVYNGNMLREVSILYDCFNDILVLKNVRANYLTQPVVPQQDLIQSFEINNQLYIRLNEVGSLTSGFYRLDYEKDSIRLVTKIKKEQRGTSNGTVEYVETSSYYLVRDEIVVPVESWKSLADLGDKSIKQIKDFRSKAHLKIPKNGISDIISLMDYCLQ